MPYCGTQWVEATVTACSNGSKPTKYPAGSGMSDEPGKTASTVTTPPPTYMYNQDTTPVQVGNVKKPSGGYSGIPSGTYNVPNMTNVTDARNTFNEIWGAGTAPGATRAEKAQLDAFLAGLRRYTGSEIGTRGSAETAWGDVLKDASRAGVDAFALLGTKNPADTDDGSSGSGRGYSGPVAQTAFMDERDVDRTANALALELIGRPLSQKELSKVTARLRSEEKANPTVMTPNGPGASTTQSGLSAEGRADVLREVISENPEYQQFQVDTTVLDTMLSELNKREQMVNGR